MEKLKKKYKEYRVVSVPSRMIGALMIGKTPAELTNYFNFTEEEEKTCVEIDNNAKDLTKIKIYRLSGFLNFFCNTFDYSVVSVSTRHRDDGDGFLVTFIKD